MVTIREKFSKFSTKLLVITMLTIVALGTSLGVNGYRTTVQQIKINNHANLLSKGRTLVKNNSQAMSGMAEDNAFIAIRELVSSTEREDKDIAYGIFMDSQRRPWAFAHSDTLDSLTEQPLDDSLSIWAAGLEMSGWREIDLDGTQIFEFAAPVVSESLRLGTIRYGMTTAGMQEAISEAKRAAFGKSLAYPITFLVIGFILFFFQNRASRRQADAITTPLQHLTKAAEGIAAGDYLSPITTESNDEVGLLAQAFETMRSTVKQYTENLEDMVAERTEQLKEAQKELVEKAHRAGMADIATGTLHNVGNILNSVKTSVDIIAEVMVHSSTKSLSKANELLRENLSQIETFITKDPRGKKLMQYYLKLEEGFKEDYEHIEQASTRLSEKVNAIIDVIAAQQNYAGVASLDEEVSLAAIVEDALTMQSGSIERYKIRIERSFNASPKVIVQKTKLVHVLLNLIKNAKEAMMETEPEERLLSITVNHDNSAAYVRISDTGLGIPPENLTRVFNHGFTTKTGGHGFGLHSSANYMKEMAGDIWAENNENKPGATFVLKFTKFAKSSKHNLIPQEKHIIHS